jgi:lipopolysaccharide export system protein LptA
LMAATITMDGALGTLSARAGTPTGVILAIFPGGALGAEDVAKAKAEGTKLAGSAPAKSAKPAAPRSVRVSSRELNYADKTREAVFAGNVVLTTGVATVRAQRAVVLMKPKPLAAKAVRGAVAPPSTLPRANPTASEIDRIVASGAVHVVEPGRVATGDQLLYTAATGEMVLTGTDEKAPKVVDAQEGDVTGKTLIFGTRDNTVVVSGAPKHGRVRTETEVKP